MLTRHAQCGPGNQFHPVEGVLPVARTQELDADGSGSIDKRKIWPFVPSGTKDLHKLVGIRVGTQWTSHNG